MGKGSHGDESHRDGRHVELGSTRNAKGIVRELRLRAESQPVRLTVQCEGYDVRRDIRQPCPSPPAALLLGDPIRV